MRYLAIIKLSSLNSSIALSLIPMSSSIPRICKQKLTPASVPKQSKSAREIRKLRENFPKLILGIRGKFQSHPPGKGKRTFLRRGRATTNFLVENLSVATVSCGVGRTRAPAEDAAPTSKTRRRPRRLRRR